MFPIPVNGATIPPNRNGEAPNKAAAMPRFSVTARKARVIVTGVNRPTHKSIKNKNTSNNPNGHPLTNAHEANKAN